MSSTSNVILVVEDDPLIRMDLLDMIEEFGYRTMAAENADSAIALLQQHTEIVAVVTDVDMPGSMNGIKLAGLINKRWPPCKLLVVSGAHDIAAADLPDGARFLSKPVRRDMIGRIFAGFGLSPAV